MAYFVYILECTDKSFYTGITWNLKKRIFEHNNHVRSCLRKNQLPVRLVYWEKHLNRFSAAQREKEIKGWRREKKIAIINGLR